ncbi:hypothetical protein EUTSA_v10027634mg [Eutrema salsugineum]|uniref:ADP-ribosyl cyclase/cyclic ADP-ribose hydrolase n=1 Tax=Eutrema salsugineum TaxID=72664 RepID=V4LAG4_EUTSA|nr:hypothetical protein EUTSA_v10027634mg [Eutrema salsugineum]
MSSSSSPLTWKYRVFTSFHGPDVRKTFLSHLRKQFSYNGITMFDDNGIERGQIIAPSLTQAIRESRIAVVLLSKNYASSSWCLDELLEILNCKEARGQKVMTVFYGVDPSEVRKQTGDFGKAFHKTCARKTKEERRKWSEALTYVGNIAGEHFQNWKSEAEMIEKIASDVSDKLNATPCRDFDGMVGLEGHLREMESLLDLDNDGVKIVGICGPAGIGKSTIARALHSRLSNMFKLTCFVDDLPENYKIGYGEYKMKKQLGEQLLSKILSQPSMIIGHLGVIQERLNDQKVLITLDDVESLDQLEALANTMWFGAGSRVIVTTENKEILQQHGISDIYQVGFPSKEEALMIFCLSAFRQISPPDGFMNLADEVANICGNLPLGLHVLGSLLRGKNHADWIDELPRLKRCLDRRIESVMKVGYESLYENDQALFLHVAVFFNHEHIDHVTSMMAKTNSEVRLGLRNLANKYLIHIDRGSRVVMHRLLQVMARQVISRQETWKRQILVDPKEICYVLENAAGNGSIVGVSFDVSEINELTISARAFERMCNIFLLKVYHGRHTGKGKLHIPEEFEFPCRVSLLHWEVYPRRSLPLRFCTENLVELKMQDSNLEKLWEGTQTLANLKKMDFKGSSLLKALPDLSNATNLEELDISFCDALEELPSSIANLDKTNLLQMDSCKSLEVIPSLVKLTSLELIKMWIMSRLRILPDIPTSILKLSVNASRVEELPASLRHCSRLESVELFSCTNLKTFSTHLPTSVKSLDLGDSGIEMITDCIKGLHNLEYLHLSSCKRLAALPELPGSLIQLYADDCESLERVSGTLNTSKADLIFTNCIKLGLQARRAIIRRSFVSGWALLPGTEVPAEFHHRARGKCLTIGYSTFNRFKVCVVIKQNLILDSRLWYRCLVNDKVHQGIVLNLDSLCTLYIHSSD